MARRRNSVRLTKAAAEKAAALNLAPLGVEAPPRVAPKAAMRRAPMKASGKFLPWQVYTISTDGRILA